MKGRKTASFISAAMNPGRPPLSGSHALTHQFAHTVALTELVESEQGPFTYWFPPRGETGT